MGLSYAKEILSITLSHSPGGSTRREVGHGNAFGTNILCEWVVLGVSNGDTNRKRDGVSYGLSIVTL